jgi:hypothetical protein
LFDYCELNLVNESQPSIRIVIEWLVVKMLQLKLEKLDDESYFLNKLKNVSSISFKSVKNNSNKTQGTSVVIFEAHLFCRF